MNQTERLAALARVAANPAIGEPHLGKFAQIAIPGHSDGPGTVRIQLLGLNERTQLNTLIAWACLLDQPIVTLIDYGPDSTGVHIHVSGHLAGDHVSAWDGVAAEGAAAASLRQAMHGEKRATVPLYVLRSTAVRLSDGNANLARVTA